MPFAPQVSFVLYSYYDKNILISFLVLIRGNGEAYYAPKLEMLKESDAIAIVNIVDSRSEKNQGEPF